ncbi:hypothetical protein M670_02631 [Schinkia azotoformans MEV2011]|uniref:Uncharacterized protein n=2 Tax=Schinkia azotoformans TaxID=1454 RepID=A0A072NL87_SCHAZ|nr:hypothetical protein [Schinkia azotoformans]KEF38211.1 hypothetical protein M670_02631 [Schinkia azotoformans MEV2011]MEC1697409.1 hypothetical protein [Schinkia azotoformans]MEC1723428.1 hypothetical protein [Schinkia azotoformans]MEC1768492.1 hypothetical protein [Schinkia azotoformans]MEC1770332.1 hypothetical protein [Schinkia azotoformans]
MNSKYSKSIELYGKCIGNLEISPFESVDLLHRRSDLERVVHELTEDQKMKLSEYDLKLIDNAKIMSEHIQKAYDFSVSDHPLSEWWWHLDLVANGKSPFNLNVELEPDEVK